MPLVTHIEVPWRLQSFTFRRVWLKGESINLVFSQLKKIEQVVAMFTFECLATCGSGRDIDHFIA